MANSLSFTQVATIMADVMAQAQGKENVIAPINETQFIAMAQTTLKSGNDNMLNAISQVLSRTIFSVRPYRRKLKAMYADEIRYGNHVRKESPIDGTYEDDPSYTLTDGQSVDQWTIAKPKVLQMNWYGSNALMTKKTYFRHQLNQAVKSSAEFGSFVQMITQNVSDMNEQKYENEARQILANMITAKVQADPDNVIYLITEYKNEVGIVDPDFDYRAPANYGDFARWLYGYLETLSDRLTERCIKYHMNITDKEIMRHTPKDAQIMYLYAPVMNDIKTRVKSVTFNEEDLNIGSYERLSFWQNINDPMKVSNKPVYINSAGEEVDASDAVTVDNVFGVIFDRDCAGYTIIDNWVSTTPMNSAGSYYNTHWHFLSRPWLDLTENAVILLLSEDPS